MLEIAQAEQVFAGGSEEANLWGPDTRWSEMGRARVEEIWRRCGVLQNSVTEIGHLARQKTADITLAHAQKEQITYFREFITGHKIALYAVILAGAFATVLFALLWGALVQTRVNAILGCWARKL